MPKIRISTKCEQNAGCVGIEFSGDAVAIHDTKNPGRDPIRMSRTQFGALLDEIKADGLGFPNS